MTHTIDLWARNNPTLFVIAFVGCLILFVVLLFAILGRIAKWQNDKSLKRDNWRDEYRNDFHCTDLDH